MVGWTVRFQQIFSDVGESIEILFFAFGQATLKVDVDY
jgi:hypothetical protein